VSATVAVTGATGFLGRRLVKLLCEQGHQVKCLVRPSSDTSDLKAFLGDDSFNALHITAVSLTNREQCANALADCDVLYHLAAGMNGSTATLFLDSVHTMSQLGHAALDAKVARFVLIGSLGIYGAAQLPYGSELNEETPVDAAPHQRDPYTYSKAMQERAAFKLHAENGLPLVVVRPGVIFGPGKGAMSSRIGLSLGSLLLRFGGSQQLPYVDVDNCAQAILLAGTVPNIEGEVFNIVDDDLPTGNEVLKMYKQLNRAPRNVWIPLRLVEPLCALYEKYHHFSSGQLPGVLTRYKAASMWRSLMYSNAKAKAGLGWNSKIGMKEALWRSLKE
jgi:nucleoside-diphosphate-sugar epimerase